MSSEIPLYAVVDKSRKKINQDEINESGAMSDAIESDEDAPQIPPKKLTGFHEEAACSGVASPSSDAVAPTIDATRNPTLCNAAFDANASDLNVPPLPVKHQKNPPPLSLNEVVEDRNLSKNTNPEPPLPAMDPQPSNEKVRKNPPPFYELVDGFHDRSEPRRNKTPPPDTEQHSTAEAKVLTTGNKTPTGTMKYRIMFCLTVTVMGVLILAISAAVLIFVVLGLRSDIAALEREWSTFQQNISRASEKTAASVEHNYEELAEWMQNYSLLLSTISFQGRNYAELKLNYSEFLEQFSLLSRNSTLYAAAIRQLEADLECPSFVSSCASLPSHCPSGYYLTVTVDGSVKGIFCDMALSCGNITGGWMRVAELNMTDTSQQCPGELVETMDNNTRRCEAVNDGCSSTIYPTLNINYRKVCGRITGYQVGSTNAFKKYIDNKNITFINSTYVDGVSLTYGDPREHIWTFAAALDRNDTLTRAEGRSSHCPCRFVVDRFDPPSFVGEDYFCDAGNEEFMTGETGLQTDPLWEGTNCLCCVSDNPPWFYKQLPQPTTDDIQMRVCKDEIKENIAITEIEIYVQ